MKDRLFKVYLRHHPIIVEVVACDGRQQDGLFVFTDSSGTVVAWFPLPEIVAATALPMD